MIKATQKDRELVIDILVSAFDPYIDNNSINLIIKPDNKRTHRLKILMGYIFDTGILFGEVLISDDRKGCLVVNYPEKKKTTIKTILKDLNLALRCIGIERIFEVIKREKIAKQHSLKEKHIKIGILGVKSEYKGKGTAARFMLDVKNHYSDNTLPVAIDTASEYNVRLYEKFGFKTYYQDNSLGYALYFMRLN